MNQDDSLSATKRFTAENVFKLQCKSDSKFKPYAFCLFGPRLDCCNGLKTQILEVLRHRLQLNYNLQF